MVGLILQALAITAWLRILGRFLMSWIDPRFRRPLGRSFLGVLVRVVRYA